MQKISMLWYANPLQSKSPMTILYVGGRGGADAYTEFLRRHGHVKTIGIEPEEHSMEALKQSNAFTTIISEAFLDSIGTKELYITKALGWCSMLKPNVAAIKKIATKWCLQNEPYTIIHTKPVHCVTLDSMYETIQPVDYLQVDVQGSELFVLRGAKATLPLVSIIEVEARFYPIYENEPSFFELHSFLEANNFMLFYSTPQSSIEFGNNYVEVNACYYNTVLMQKDPIAMKSLLEFTRLKHTYTDNKFLSLLKDVPYKSTL